MSSPAPPVQLIRPRRHGDARGWFTEVYSEATFAKAGIACRFVQDNHSFSAPAFTLRGLHYQSPPHAQAKLVRCIRGRIWDVAVDIRRGSPSFGHHVAAELSAADGHQLFVPEGYAHGFLTLEPDCEVSYKVSALYAADADHGIAWDDPALAIPWPLPPGRAPELSDKDRRQPPLAAAPDAFGYDGQPLAPLS